MNYFINYIKNFLRNRISEKIECNKCADSEEDRLKIFFDAAFEGVAITENGKFIDGNDRFTEMFGYTKKELLGKSIIDLVYINDQELVQKRMKENYTEVYEHRCVHKNGSIRYVEVHGKTTKYNGKFVRITAIHDITRRKKDEKERIRFDLHKSQISKMEAIGSFANGIAHDFNNALQPIIGNCDIILYEMRNDDNCRIHKKNIKSIVKAAEVASLLVRRIQSFARTNGEELLQPLNVSNCVKEAFEFLRSMIPKSVKMELNIEKGLGIALVNDVTIKQILMNICKNSYQAMENEQGSIVIDVYNEELIEERFGIPEGKYIRIEIEDNGKGMSPEIVSRSFDPYFTTKDEGEGTGIGLSVVDRIIRNYKGFIRIYSEVNRGTKVAIYIPAYLKGNELDAKFKIMEEVIMGDRERILLVDDEESIIEAVTKILESLNYKVTPFISSRLALEEFKINSNKYDMVLTDLTMPELTGLNLIQKIKIIRPDIKIILCSGLSSSNNDLEQHEYFKYVDVYVRKPVTRLTYSKALSKVLNGK
jgi:PAS domain S-box-containing protein